MEVAYDHEARACSCLVRLSKTLNAWQLQVVLQASIRPLITLKALPKYMEQIAIQQETKGCPEDKTNKYGQSHQMRHQIQRWDYAKENAGNLQGQSKTTSHLHPGVQIPQRGGKEGPKM